MQTTTHRVALERSHVAALDDGRGLGPLGETLAARHLVSGDGLQLVARNWRVAEGALRGELDLVATDPRDGTLVVCEVKTRRDAERFGGAVAALAPRKRARIRALTAAFLRHGAPRCPRVRLDLIAIDLGRGATLTHLEAAL